MTLVREREIEFVPLLQFIESCKTSMLLLAWLQ